MTRGDFGLLSRDVIGHYSPCINVAADATGTSSPGQARRLAGKITVPALPRSELTGLIAEDSRWQLLSRCLRERGIPLDVRTAGAFLLLYGQFVSRLAYAGSADQ